MGPDVEVADAGPVREDEAYRRLATALASARLEQMGDRAGAEGVAVQRQGDGGGQFLGAVVIEQGEEPDRGRAARRAARRQALEEGGGQGHGDPASVPRGVDVRVARGGAQAVEMRGVFEGLAGVVAPPMAGHLGLAIQDAHLCPAGHEREWLAHVRVGNRVLVPIDAHVGGLAGAHRAEQLGLKRVRRQREEAGPFLGPEVGDRTVALFGVAPLVGDLVPPPAKLGVEVVEVPAP